MTPHPSVLVVATRVVLVSWGAHGSTTMFLAHQSISNGCRWAYDAILTDPALLSRAPLLFRFQVYHQQTILNNSSPSTGQAIKSRRCLKILRTLIILMICGTTVLSPMIRLHSLPGYHTWIQVYGIATFKNAVSAMWGNVHVDRGIWNMVQNR